MKVGDSQTPSPALWVVPVAGGQGGEGSGRRPLPMG